MNQTLTFFLCQPILHAHIKIMVWSASQSSKHYTTFFFSRDDHRKIYGEKCAKYRYTVLGPFSAMFTYLVRVVRIDDLYQRYAWAVNIANEWLQTYGSHAVSEGVNQKSGSNTFLPILRAHIKIMVSSCSQRSKHYIN